MSRTVNPTNEINCGIGDIPQYKSPPHQLLGTAPWHSPCGTAAGFAAALESSTESLWTVELTGNATRESDMMLRSSQVQANVQRHSAPGSVRRAICRNGRMSLPRLLAFSTSTSHGRSSCRLCGASDDNRKVALVLVDVAVRTLAIGPQALSRVPPSICAQILCSVARSLNYILERAE